MLRDPPRGNPETNDEHHWMAVKLMVKLLMVWGSILDDKDLSFLWDKS